MKTVASGVSCHRRTVLLSLQNSNPQTDVPKEDTVPRPESRAPSVRNHCKSAENRSNIPDSPLPTIVISQCDSPLQAPEEVEANPQPQPAANTDSSNENCSQDNPEDSDNPLTSHFKMFMRGLTRSRSQDSLSSAKTSGDEEPSDSGLQQDGPEGLPWLSFSAKSNKKEKTYFRMSGVNKVKGKEAQQGTLPRGEDFPCQRGQVNWEQLEATKAIFDLLKEISGLFNFESQTGFSHSFFFFIFIDWTWGLHSQLFWAHFTDREEKKRIL